MARSRFTGNMHAYEDDKPRSALINGLGVYQKYVHPRNLTKHYIPRKIFRVEAGKRYRMRVISNAGLSCPFQFSVDHHNLTMIASDGRSFKPFEAESFIIHSGERYDFILNANVSPARNHWMRIRGLSNCMPHKVHQEAVLRYSGAPDKEPTESTDYEKGDRKGVQLNPIDSGLDGDKVPVAEMMDSFPNIEEDTKKGWAKPVADSKHYIHYDFSFINNPHYNNPDYYPLHKGDKNPVYTPQINYISFTFPPAPLLTQYHDIPQEMFCNHNQTAPDTRCREAYCECIHLIKIKLNDVAEIFLIDRGDTFKGATHPFHLHGYSVRLAAYEKLNRSVTVDEIKRMDNEGKIHRNLNRTVQKDTIAVPSGGFSILRIHARNPGFWLLHCHIDFHLELGMGIVVQVGELHQMQHKPKKFPKCGNWVYGENAGQTNTFSTALTITSSLLCILFTFYISKYRSNCHLK